MKILEAGENYLEAILMLEKKTGSVRAIDIVNHMNYSRPTVSIAMKEFREEGYITTDEKGFISLTAKGRSIAEKIYERHEIIAQILMAIGVDEKTAYTDSCKIEHDLSELSFKCIKDYYNTHFKDKK